MHVVERASPGSQNSEELAVILGALNAFKKGDASVRLPLDWSGVTGRIAETFNEVVERNERMAHELSRLSRIVGKEGCTQATLPICIRICDSNWPAAGRVDRASRDRLPIGDSYLNFMEVPTGTSCWVAVQSVPVCFGERKCQGSLLQIEMVLTPCWSPPQEREGSWRAWLNDGPGRKERIFGIAAADQFLH